MCEYTPAVYLHAHEKAWAQSTAVLSPSCCNLRACNGLIAHTDACTLPGCLEEGALLTRVTSPHLTDFARDIFETWPGADIEQSCQRCFTPEHSLSIGCLLHA